MLLLARYNKNKTDNGDPANQQNNTAYLTHKHIFGQYVEENIFAIQFYASWEM